MLTLKQLMPTMKNMNLSGLSCALAALLMVLMPLVAEAGPVGSAVRKEAARRALVRDLARDAATKAVPLSAERNVFRYTTAAQARRELRSGIAAGSHMTSRATAGRPPLGLSAQRQYGLPTRPEVRLTIKLERGTLVKSNKAIAGGPGKGELVTVNGLPAANISKGVPLR